MHFHRPLKRVESNDRIHIRQPCIGKSVRRIFGYRLLEVLRCAQQTFFAPLIPVVTALQIQVVRFFIVRIAADQCFVFGCDQMALHLFDNRARDFILNLEDIMQIAIVFFRPQMITVRNIDQVGDDANPVPRFSYASFQYRGNVQLLADSADVRMLIFKLKRGGPGGDAQARNLCERADQLFGNAIAKIFLITLRRHVGKRKNGDCRRFLDVTGDSSLVAGLKRVCLHNPQCEDKISGRLKSVCRLFFQTVHHDAH